ncbi:MAG: hypothetical protein CMF25_05935 [Kangiellaceae bacterium]|nr:hypothetical protein [Kangiellaceae bacterium]|tara:strand:+ start:2592 stop:4712 length:2121 start_codon:yes stop_codon:yes gene_type:complete
MLNKLTLRHKLISIILLVSLVGILVGFVAVGFQYYHSRKDVLVTQSVTVARLLAEYSEAPLSFGDASGAKALLAGVEIDGLKVAAIFDQKDQLFASISLQSPSSGAASSGASIPSLADFPIGHAIRDDNLHVRMPIGANGQVFGTVYLQVAMEQVYASSNDFVAILVGIGVVALFLCFTLASRLQNYISRPLLALMQTSIDVRERGDYSLRAPQQSKDEIGMLSENFNRMLETIEVQQTERDNAEDALNESNKHLEKAVKELQFLANYDSLTQLPNRALCIDRLKSALNRASRNQQRVGLLFIDLDHFKDVNDSMGHAVGDSLLKAASRRLSGIIRESDTLARQSGDEFVIVLDAIQDKLDAMVVVDKIVDAFNQSFHLDNCVVNTTVSIGVCIYPQDGADAATLMRNADTAMYKSKEAGRNNFQFYSPEMNSLTLRRLHLANDLRKALKNDDLFVVYQPQMAANGESIVGVESLVRWEHPSLGYISPAEFIPIAESTGLIIELGEWVLKAALKQGRLWQEQGYTQLRVAVNLSAAQFRQHELPSIIDELVSESGFPAALLELEVTESMVMKDVEIAITALENLKRLGYQLAIDDFGTGYSSLAYLRRFPIDALKIDRSFVDELVVDKDDTAITLAILSMAKSLRLKVIAEGVENTVQRAFLAEHNCDEIQGFLYSPGVPAEQLTGFLEQYYAPVVEIADEASAGR